MGIRLTKAIGYGMPIDEFYQHLLLPVDRDEYLGDELDRLGEGFAHLVYGGTDTVWRLIDGGVITDDKSIEPLIRLVGDHGDADHVLMFPTIHLAKDWLRFDNTMDYVFARAGKTESDLPQGFVHFVDGIPPFADLKMDRNGVEVKCGPDDNSWEFHRDPALIPGVPDALRWWLLHCGVFSLDGVAKLRPMAAEWWG